MLPSEKNEAFEQAMVLDSFTHFSATKWSFFFKISHPLFFFFSLIQLCMIFISL